MSKHKIRKDENDNFIKSSSSNSSKENENIPIEKSPKPLFDRYVSQKDIEKYGKIDPNVFHDETEDFIRKSKEKIAQNDQKIARDKQIGEDLRLQAEHAKRLLASINPSYHPQVFDNRPQQTTGQDFTNVGPPHYLGGQPSSKTSGNLRTESYSPSEVTEKELRDAKEEARRSEEKRRKFEEKEREAKEKLAKLEEKARRKG